MQDEARPEDQPLLISDTARILRCTDKTVRIYDSEGRLRSARTPGGVRIFRRGDVEQFAAERERGAARTVNVTPADAALLRASNRLTGRAAALEARIDDGDGGAWPEYLSVVATLATLKPRTIPGADGGLLTTKEMAQRLGVSSKTLLRRRAAGQMRPELELGARGRVLRWGAEAGR